LKGKGKETIGLREVKMQTLHKVELYELCLLKEITVSSTVTSVKGFRNVYRILLWDICVKLTDFEKIISLKIMVINNNNT
jgi:hypothetical protein